MISFNSLGVYGRLGNQMFQYAALKGIAAYKNYKYSIPSNSIQLKNCFNIPPTLKNNNVQTVYLKKYEYDKEFVNNCPDNVDIVGYFQSEKYFQHIKEEIRKDFTFKDFIIANCNNFLKGVADLKNTIALHIRRTDYLTDQGFACLDLQYYYDALQILNHNLSVIVFSDDIEWCKRQQIFKNERFIFSEQNDFEDLYTMSQCGYHIIANSSFSWWGSWLAQSIKTIAPLKWFDGTLSQWKTNDLRLNDWIVI
jgi:hypothetical protein